MERHKKKIITFYEEEAKIYDSERFFTAHGKYVDRIQKDIVLSMGSWKGRKILDIGCGTGRFAIELAEHQASVVALDPSLNMLNTLGWKLKDKNIVGTIDLVRASGYQLPFRDDTFDGCISINVINHLPDHHKMLGEVHRIVKPNGFFIMNFPNMLSSFLPAALWINFRKRSLYNNVYSHWFNLPRVNNDLNQAGFKVKVIKGSMLLPAFLFSRKLAFLLQKLGQISRDSPLKYITGSVFIKAEKAVE